MTGGNEIRFRFALDGAQQVKAGADSVAGSLGQVGRSARQAASDANALPGIFGASSDALRGMAVAAAAVTVGTGFARAFVQAADSVTVLNNQLKLATGSAAAAQQAYGALFGIAQRSRTSFTELGATYASIARATGDLGISQARLLTVTEAIGNALAISGGNAQGMQAALTQLGQGFASGTLRGEELNSVLEQTPRLAKAIADGLGVTIGKLREMGQEGKLTSEAVLGALESQARVLAGEVKDSVATVAQAMTQLGNAAVALAGQMDQASGATKTLSGVTQAAANDLGRFSDAMTRAEKAGQGFVGQLATAAAVGLGRGTFDLINASASKLNQTINYLTGGMAGLDENVRVMPLALQSTAEQAGTLERSLNDARAEWEQLRAQGEREGKSIYLRSAMGDLEAYIARTEVALQNMRRLQGFNGDPGGGRGSVNPQTVGARLQEEAAAQAKVNDLRAKALGVNAGLTDSLVALDKAQQLGVISQAEQIKLAQDLVAQTYKSTKAAKDHDAALEASRDIAKAWSDAIRDAQKILAETEADTLGLTKAQQLLIQYLQSPAYLQASDAMRQVALQTMYAAHASELAAAADRERAKAREALDAAGQKYMQTIAEQAAAAEREAQSLRDQVVELTYGEGARELLIQQRLDDAAAQAQQIANASLWLEGSTAETQALQRLADRLRDVAEARRGVATAERAKDQRQAQADAAQRAAEDWQRTADDIRTSLTDAFRRAFESGSSFGEAFARTIANEIKARISTALAGSLADAVLSIVGLSAGAAGAGGQNGAAGGVNWMQAAGSATTLYRYGANAYNWATGSGAAMLSTSAGTLGVTGAQGAFVGEGAASGVAAWDAAAAASTSATGGSSLASTSSTWGPYVAAIVASYLISDNAYRRGFTSQNQNSTFWESPLSGEITNAAARLMDSLGIGSTRTNQIFSGAAGFNYLVGRGAPRIDAQGVTGALVGGAFDGTAFADIRQKGGLFRSDKTWTETGALSAELDRFFDTAAAAVMDKAKDYGAALGLPVEALANVTHDIKVALTDDAQKNMEAITEALSGYGDALVASYAEALRPLALYGESTAKTIERVGAAISGVNSVFESLGLAALQASVDGGAAAVRLQEAFGGLGGLQQAASIYVGAIYSDAEQVALAMSQVGDVLSGLGLAVPTTRAGFKSLVDDLVNSGRVATEAGAQQLQALLGVAGAFGQIQDAAEALNNELASAVARALPKFGRADRYGDIQAQLAGVGVSLSRQQLVGASKDDLFAFAQAYVGMADATHEARLAVVDAASALADLRDEADNAAAELARNVLQGLSAAIGDFVGPRELATFRAGEVRNTLSGAGISASVEQILGSTRDDIVALWKAVGTEGKAAILEAYDAWQAMRDAILQADIAAIVEPLGTTADELLAAYAELTPAADNLVQAWRNTRDEVKILSDALSEIDGAAAVSAIDALRKTVTQRDGLQGVIDDNSQRIFDLQVGQGGARALALLKRREGELWAQFASTSNPEVARAITQTTLQRIALEGDLQRDANAAQIDALRDQLATAERLRDVAAEMSGFILGLKAGNLSNLGYAGRLAASEALFANSLTTGVDVQGNATALLQNAQAAFGGATGAYSDVFDSVTGRLQGIGAADFGAQVSDAQAQLQALESVGDNTEAQILALGELNSRFGTGLESLNVQISTQTQAVRDQITELQTLQANQERQIKQFGEALTRLIDASERTAAAAEEANDQAALAGAAP